MSLEVWQANVEGWFMVFISSAACVVGASIVFIDKVWHRRQGSILSSRAFQASSLALASGVLLISSLAVLFPESQARLQSTPTAYFWFLFGAFMTLCLTRIIHCCTPKAIHSCGTSVSPVANQHTLYYHNQEQQKQTDESLSTSTSSTSTSPTMIPTLSEQQLEQPEEQQPLQPTPALDYGSTFSDAPFRFHEQTQHQKSHDIEGHPHLHNHRHHHLHHDLGHEHISIINNKDMENGDNHSHRDDSLDLEHDKDQFWSMGIQTAIAICVHKFPEGLIMFISSQASSSLGLSVAAAMSIHNLTEGFMMALPIYYATGSRTNAFLYASFMGGLSQPLGALIGLLTFESVTKDQEDVMFGITFGIISGMMSFITIQSMLPQAIKVDGYRHHVVFFFFLGVFLVGLTSLLKTI